MQGIIYAKQVAGALSVRYCWLLPASGLQDRWVSEMFCGSDRQRVVKQEHTESGVKMKLGITSQIKTNRNTSFTSSTPVVN